MAGPLDITIRPALAGDAARLVELCQLLGHYPRLDEVRDGLAAPAEPRHVILVAVLQGTAVGFAEVAARSTLSSGRWAELTALAVAERSRRRGVGSALVEAARSWAKGQGVDRLRVRTRTERSGAAHFYERQGFRLSKEQRVYDAEL